MGGCELEGKWQQRAASHHPAVRCLTPDGFRLQVPHAGLDPPKIIRFASPLRPSLSPLQSHPYLRPLSSMVAHEGLRLELIGSASMPVAFTDLFRDCTDAFPASRPTAAALFGRLQKMRNQHTAP